MEEEFEEENEEEEERSQQSEPQCCDVSKFFVRGEVPKLQDVNGCGVAAPPIRTPSGRTVSAGRTTRRLRLRSLVIYAEVSGIADTVLK